MAQKGRSKIVPPRAEALASTWSKSGYHGVDEPRPGRFRAVIGKHVWRSRYFSTAREAALAYDKEAVARWHS